MTRRRWGLLAELLLGLGVLIAALHAFANAAERVRFQGDESKVIARGRYFDYLFLQRDLGRNKWGSAPDMHHDDNEVHTHPMLTNYLVGGSLWAAGYDLDPDKLPRAFRFGKSVKWNKRDGRVPDGAMLAAARAPMVASAVAAAISLYAIGRLLCGRVAGTLAAALFIAAPGAQNHMIRAKSDGPFVFFMLLALLVGVLAVRRSPGGGPPVRRAVALGLALGLGFATKLTAWLGLVAVLAFGLLVALNTWRGGHSSFSSRFKRAAGVGLTWALPLATALGLFVLTNPHLYSNPVLHTGHLFELRATEMRNQQRTYPELAVLNAPERPGYMLYRSFVEMTFSGSRGVPLEAPLAALGLGVLFLRAWRGWRRAGRVGPEAFALVTVIIYFAGVSAGLLLNWQRYSLPTLALGTLLSGIGIASLASLVPKMAARFRERLAVTRANAPAYKREGSQI